MILPFLKKRTCAMIIIKDYNQIMRDFQVIGKSEISILILRSNLKGKT